MSKDEIKDVSVELDEDTDSKSLESDRAKKETVMSKVLNDSATPPSVEDVVEGKVIGIEKSRVYIDIPPFGTGIIYGREYINARDIIKKNKHR